MPGTLALAGYAQSLLRLLHYLTMYAFMTRINAHRDYLYTTIQPKQSLALSTIDRFILLV
jgi:hypothetical protein